VSDSHDIGAYLADRDLQLRGEQVQRDRHCEACNGTGWERRFVLTTYEGGETYSHPRRQRITEQQYNDLRGKVDGRTQRVDDGVARCTQCEYGRHMKVLDSTAPEEEQAPRPSRRKSAGFQRAGDLMRRAAGEAE
jgi:hypothetical protein